MLPVDQRSSAMAAVEVDVVDAIFLHHGVILFREFRQPGRIAQPALKGELHTGITVEYLSTAIPGDGRTGKLSVEVRIGSDRPKPGIKRHFDTR